MIREFADAAAAWIGVNAVVMNLDLWPFILFAIGIGALIGDSVYQARQLIDEWEPPEDD